MTSIWRHVINLLAVKLQVILTIFYNLRYQSPWNFFICKGRISWIKVLILWESTRFSFLPIRILIISFLGYNIFSRSSLSTWTSGQIDFLMTTLPYPFSLHCNIKKSLQVAITFIFYFSFNESYNIIYPVHI